MTDITKTQLTKEQEEIFHAIEHEHKNMFVTGKAGTGKSTLLNYLKRNTKKNMAVVAPTGVAALNVGGQTIHSFFRIPPTFLSEDNIEVYPKTAELLRKVDIIVIDEVSMVRADLMDAIDYILRVARKNDLSFGGVQMVMFGDPFQLPPIVREENVKEYFLQKYGGYYFFNAHSWNYADIEVCELSTIFRQKDEGFKKLLNQIRHGDVTNETLNALNARHADELPENDVIYLATRNHVVDRINKTKLKNLKTKEQSYKAVIKGRLEPSALPTDKVLDLRIGAQVMFLRNDKERRWVNGTIGTVKWLNDGGVGVEIGKETYTVMKETWDKIQYSYNTNEQRMEEEVVSSFTQYPLKLAWAITVHKSQGQTYDSVIVDMDAGAFSHGQTYVALSRCTQLETLYLKRKINLRDIIVDPQVTAFMDSAKNKKDKLHEEELIYEEQ
ncbi:MAG: AAA family ATPase [Candidatus Moranbacteria bacterium]|nr:AAA family ATPase [Candidatus Moranbacteria bacterium]